MTECNERIYKFEKGKALGFVEHQNGNIWQSFKLSITFGDEIGTVDPYYMFYSVMTDNRGYVIDEFLNYGDFEYPINDINYLSAELSKDGQFIITGSSNGAFTPPVIGRGNMTLTEYGEKVFSECLGNTLEYHAPADNSDHSDDQASGETYNEYSESCSAMNLDIL